VRQGAVATLVELAPSVLNLARYRFAARQIDAAGVLS
jgi:hypothetical protein